MRAVPMIGRAFARLTVAGAAPTLSGHRRWICHCECGSESIVAGHDLRAGRTKSCGCLNLELVTQRATSHGGTRTRPYRIWRNMLDRCEVESRPAYKWYGARGITVCREWHDFAVFRAWAFASGYRDHLSLDRIQNDGNYEPDNCRWATPAQQANNRRRNPLQKLSDQDVVAILADDRLHRLIAADFGVGRQHITAIKQVGGRPPGSRAGASRRAKQYAEDYIAIIQGVA